MTRVFFRRLPALLAALMMALFALAGAAGAQTSWDEAIDRLAADSFPETEAAIGIIARSGDARGVEVLDALADRRLLAIAASKQVFWRDRAGAVFDARSGERVAEAPREASAVRLNNRLRNLVQAARGNLTLLSPDPARRAQAAEAVFRSRDPAALPTVETALERETVPKVRALLQGARAAIILNEASSPEVERLRAVRLLADIADNNALILLRQLAARTDAGPLRQAIDEGIAAIERIQRLREVGLTVWFGISLGSVLLLVAIGLAITFGVMGVINMAHGEMVMIGAYTTFVIQELFRASAPHLLDWSLPLAIPAAFLVTGALGVAIERGVLRVLYGRPLETLLATFGISLILQQAVRTWFGPTNREVSAPSYMAGSIDVLGMQITSGRLWIVVFSLLVFIALLVVLKATPLGRQMRAVTQNRRMAASMGIRTRFVDAMTFGLGSGVAGIAGVALSQIDNVSPNLGQSYIIDSFMVVVFGGVGNLWGTLISAFTLGIANKVLEPFVGAVLGKIMILVLLILFIQKRPRGLFALKGRAVEA